MPSNTPRNSYRSTAAPQPTTRPSSSRYLQRESELPPQPRGFYRKSELPPPQPQGFYRESELPPPQPRGSHRQPELPPPRPRDSHREPGHQSSRSHSSSSPRRAKTTAAPSNSPFARLVVTGDLPGGNNPHARHESSHHAEPSGGRHRSNAISHCRTPGNDSSASTIRGPPVAQGQVGLSRSTSFAVRSSSASSMDLPEYDPYAGALVPIQRSQTISTRPSTSSYASQQVVRGNSRARVPVASSHHTSSRSATPGNNVTYNITNINIGSNNLGGGHTDSLGGFSQIQIDDACGYTHRCRRGHSHGSSSRSRHSHASSSRSRHGSSGRVIELGEMTGEEDSEWHKQASDKELAALYEERLRLEDHLERNGYYD